MPNTKLRHPNVMTEAERLALPDPCRPIDQAIMPVRYNIEFNGNHISLHDDCDTLHNANLVHNIQAIYNKPSITTKKLHNQPQIHEADIIDRLLSQQTINVRQFIDQQQRYTQSITTNTQNLHLPLGLVSRLFNDSGISLIQEIVCQYPHVAIMTMIPTTTNSPSSKTTQNALSTIETKLYLMGQMYHIMLCVFLLCQCKSRKTLNPHITLQDLTNAINQYCQTHRNELYLLTLEEDLQIEPQHLEVALMAMDWQMSKQPELAKRTTNISSQNPLMSGKI